MTIPKLLVILSLPLVASCSRFDMQTSLTEVNAQAAIVATNKVEVVMSSAQQDEFNRRSAALLQKPIDQNAAVELMLSRSPAFQELLLRHWQQNASLAQDGRLTNPVFSFERLVSGSETEYGRLFRFGLMDILTLPARRAAVNLALDRAKVRLAAEIFAAIQQAKLAWLAAVAAEAKLAIEEKAFIGTSADAELAKRLKQTGNFTTSDRVYRQLIHAEAAVALANARQARLATREQLIRVLGLEAEAAERLMLPHELPQLAEQPWSLAEIAPEIEQRFDVRMARLDYEASLKRLGIDKVSSYTEIEFGRRYDSIKDAGSSAHKKGYELDIKLPIFDWGDMQRDALQANLLAKQQAYRNSVLTAASQLRESYNLYRTAFDIAQHYQKEILPMREILLEEATYNYNGMIIGVFEVLQVGRDLAMAQQSSIDAMHNLLSAEIAMDSVVMGRPISASTVPISTTSNSAGAGH